MAGVSPGIHLRRSYVRCLMTHYLHWPRHAAPARRTYRDPALTRWHVTQHKPSLVATQIPVEDWHVRFLDPTIADAILDRVVHTAYRLQLKGESQRKLRSPLTMPST
jgi:hypothetical protein